MIPGIWYQAWPDLPAPPEPAEGFIATPDSEPLNSVQKSILIGAAGIAVGRPLTELEAQAALARLNTHGDGRAFMAALTPRLPMR